MIEEAFRSRGIGLDNCTCFVCGTDSRDGKGPSCLHNIAAFVESERAGHAVVEMFFRGARLDYREREPHWIQVKIGACDSHLPNLRRLHELTRDGVISAERIRQAGNATE